MRTHPQRTRGSSLIEVMVSMVILVIGILGVLQMSILAASQNAIASRQTVGSLAARDLVDAIERMPYAHPALAAAAGVPQEVVIYDATANVMVTDWGAGVMPLLSSTPAILSADLKTGNLSGIEKISWKVTVETDAGGAEMGKQVEVTVRTTLPGGFKRDIQVWTMKYNPARIAGPNAVNFQEI